MNTLKNGFKYRNVWCKLEARFMCTPTALTPEIQIPNRIERGPTEILKALESTVPKYDTTGRGRYYVFMDDPLLTPLSLKHYRMYALSREAGRQTAMWLHKEHSDLFPKTLSEPEIKKFQPPEPYSKERVSEEVLLSIILQGNVADALNVYYLLEENVAVPTKLALFELLCYFNNVDSKGFNDLLVSQWFTYPLNITKNCWKWHPEINALFEFLVKQNSDIQSKAYSALICGLIKYLNIQKAYSLFVTVREKKLPLDVNAYNALLSKTSSAWHGDKNITNYIQEICSIMTKHGVQPNIGTINAILGQVNRFQSKTNAKRFVGIVLQECKKLKIDLSLGSYYFLLHVYGQRDKQGLKDITHVLNIIRGKSFTIKDSIDSQFFVSAMKLALQLGDRNMGEQIHDILLTGDNYKFLSDNFQENTYFKFYMMLVLIKSSIQEFFEFYDKHVPYIYMPEPSVMAEIVGALECESHAVITQYLLKLWSDAIAFNHLYRTMVMEPLIKLSRAAQKLPPSSPIHMALAENVCTFWKQVEAHNSKQFQTMVLSITVIGDCMILLLRGGKPSEVMHILKYAIKNSHLISEKMHREQIRELLDTFIFEGFAVEALTFVEYLSMNNYENLAVYGKQIRNHLALTDAQRTQLDNLLGENILAQ